MAFLLSLPGGRGRIPDVTCMERRARRVTVKDEDGVFESVWKVPLSINTFRGAYSSGKNEFCIA